LQLVPMKDLLDEAYKKGYAVPALNASHLEFIKAILEVAEEQRSPVIIQTAYEEIQYADGGKTIVDLVKNIGYDKDVRVAIHLDHGPNFEAAAHCIRSGYTSVMYDGSFVPFEENISNTCKVVEMAHAVGVSVEAELGQLGTTEFGTENNNAHLTDPVKAKEFVERTGVDCLAVAIGTAHGLYKGEPHLDFDRLKKITELTPVPIVLHGGTGVPDRHIKKAISLGVSKINVSTALRKAFIEGMHKHMESHPEDLMTMYILGAGMESLKEEIRNVMKMFGSAGKL
jgi:ketose-bisphosphate aldolase